MKVKMFYDMYQDDLEEKINDFIEKIEKQHMEVKDIKYSIFNSFNYVLIMYGPDRKIYLHTGTLGGENV